MAVDPTILSHGFAFALPATAGIKAGDLVNHDGTRLVDADADVAAGPLHAQFIVVAGHARDNDDQVIVSRQALCEDADLTTLAIDEVVYLRNTTDDDDATPTETRPLGVDDLVQVVGECVRAGSGTVAAQYLVDIKTPYEVPVAGTYAGHIGTGTTPSEVASGSDFIGMLLTAADAQMAFNAMVPQNAIKLMSAQLLYGSLSASSTMTWTIDVSAAHNDDAHGAVTDGIAAAAIVAGTTADIYSKDISSAFDAAGIIEPGKILGIDIDIGTDEAGKDPVILGVRLVFRCV